MRPSNRLMTLLNWMKNTELTKKARNRGAMPCHSALTSCVSMSSLNPARLLPASLSYTYLAMEIFVWKDVSERMMRVGRGGSAAPHEQDTAKVAHVLN